MKTDFPLDRHALPVDLALQQGRAPERLHGLLNDDMPALLAAIFALEERRAAVCKVDGTIIGTGAEDFTTGNTCYTLQQPDGKAFQLFDVPGIEGNESRYADMVKAAVAKAHLVVYVNGTNKKPEKATAERIGAYLHRGTQVCPVINVRGNADAYEFDEDRVALATHGNCEEALAQTQDVLAAVLGDKVLMPGHCVQGLLAFTGLATDGEDSTIHPSRARDLAVQQRNYLKHFGSAGAMVEFSQVKGIADVLDAKQATFKQDIVESNKGKVRELLSESIAELTRIRKEHIRFLSQVDPEFSKCRAAVESALATFDRLMEAGRRNAWSDFFNALACRADEIVASEFGDKDRIASMLGSALRQQQKELETRLTEQVEKQVAQLHDSLNQAARRLVEDVQRVNFQQRVDRAGETALRFSDTGPDMDLSLKEWGSIAIKIGSYAASGAAIGSAFPGIGTAVGAITGAVVGLVVSVVDWFSGRDKKIRKAQQQVQETIQEMRSDVFGRLPGELSKLSSEIRGAVGTPVLDWIDTMHGNLAHPITVINEQIARMNDTKTRLENMPYGTVRAI